MLSLVLCSLFLLSVAAKPMPLVIWHGMGDTCCNPQSMGMIKDAVQKAIPGIYVFSIELGSSESQDQMDGFFGDVNEQIDFVCTNLTKNTELTNGFNAIGFSQGGQFLRGLVQRCPTIKVNSLVTMGGQHLGVASIPGCVHASGLICKLITDMLDLGGYNSFVQHRLVQAQYFRDPLKYPEYLKMSNFLADINNERTAKNSTYNQRLTKLNKLVLVKWLNDTTVVPRDSEWFGFFKIGSDSTIVPMEQQPIYTEDWIGLKELNQKGNLVRLSVEGGHMSVNLTWFNKNIIMPYFNVQA